MKKILISLGVLLAIIVCGFAGYTYYKHTPTYSLTLIRDSVKNHDWDTFSRHVDTESVISNAFDDVIAVAMQDDAMDNTTKGLAQGFVQLLKPAMIQAMNDGVKNWVKTGEFKDGAADKNVQEQKKQQLAENFKEETNADSLTFKGVGNVTKEGKTAIVEIHFEDHKLNRDTSLKVQMNQLDDGTWQVVQIKDFQEYLLDEKKAREEKLAELNKPIQSEIDDRVTIGQLQAKIVNGDAWGFSKKLQLQAPLHLNSDKAIAALEGTLIFTNPDGKTYKKPYKVSLAVKGADSTLTLTYELNPFIDSEKKLESSLPQTKIEMKVEKLDYADGSSLALKKTLED